MKPPNYRTVHNVQVAMQRLFLAPVLAAVVVGGVLVAQTPVADPPVFEVASIKANNSGGGFIRIGMAPGGRFTAMNVPLRQLIQMAYQVQPFQIEGGPSWIASDRFDVTAKADRELPPMAPGLPGPMPMMM